MTRVTLLDVAARAGVSRATASLVLNDSPLVAEPTRARVKAAMGELGYVYDRVAASLRSRRTHAVGFVLTEFTHPYLTRFSTGAQEVLERSGTVVMFGVSHDDVRQQSQVTRAMTERLLDGLLVIPASGSTAADLAPLPGSRLVTVARRVAGLDADYVGAANAQGVSLAAAHLVDVHQRRRLAFLGGDASLPPRRERHEALVAELLRRGLTMAASVACPPDRAHARDAAALLLQRAGRPDALVCYTDTVALGALDAVADLGLTAADVAVVGFDDIPEARHARPALTSLAFPAEEAGRAAAELMLRRLDDDSGEREQIVLPMNLHVRQSCGCAARPEETL